MKIEKLTIAASYTAQAADGIADIARDLEPVGQYPEIGGSVSDLEDLTNASERLAAEARQLRNYADWLDGDILQRVNIERERIHHQMEAYAARPFLTPGRRGR